MVRSVVRRRNYPRGNPRPSSGTLGRVRALVVALGLLVAGCAPLPPPAAGAPDLRGTWTGTWGAGPITVVVTDQQAGHGDSGLVLGPWQVLGEQYPTVSGVLTTSIRGEAVSTQLAGRLADVGGGRLLVTMHARSVAGEQRLTLRLLEGDRLEGTGNSQYDWGPRGPVQLVRRAGG
jgi:hypothetical protein